MARTDTAEEQALWQSGGAEEDSRFREGDRYLRLAYDDDEEDLLEDAARLLLNGNASETQCW